MARIRIKQQLCANCNYAFGENENFCPSCGQENHSPNQPIKHYIAELIETVFHLDSKFFLSIKTMLTAPGKMTYEFNQNKRNRFMPPMRLYVFISFVFFILFQIPKKEEAAQIGNKEVIPTALTDSSSFNFTLSDTGFVRIKNKPTRKFGLIDISADDADWAFLKNAKPEQVDSILICNDITPNFITRNFYKQWLKFSTEDSTISTRLTEKIIKYFSIALFFLMPFFAFILFLLHIRRKHNYYNYLIFSIHYHSTVFIVFSILSLIQMMIVLPDMVWGLCIIGLWIYLLIAMKRNYQQSWLKTGIKAMLAASGYQLVLLLTLAMVSVLGVYFV